MAQLKQSKSFALTLLATNRHRRGGCRLRLRHERCWRCITALQGRQPRHWQGARHPMNLWLKDWLDTQPVSCAACAGVCFVWQQQHQGEDPGAEEFESGSLEQAQSQAVGKCSERGLWGEAVGCLAIMRACHQLVMTSRGRLACTTSAGPQDTSSYQRAGRCWNSHGLTLPDNGSSLDNTTQQQQQQKTMTPT